MSIYSLSSKEAVGQRRVYQHSCQGNYQLPGQAKYTTVSPASFPPPFLPSPFSPPYSFSQSFPYFHCYFLRGQLACAPESILDQRASPPYFKQHICGLYENFKLFLHVCFRFLMRKFSQAST